MFLWVSVDFRVIVLNLGVFKVLVKPPQHVTFWMPSMLGSLGSQKAETQNL